MVSPSLRSSFSQLSKAFLIDIGIPDPESEYDSESSDETFVSANHPNLAFLREVKVPRDYTLEAKNPLTGRTFAKESRNRKQMRLKALNKLKQEEKRCAKNRNESVVRKLFFHPKINLDFYVVKACIVVINFVTLVVY